jgi:hypothetical protein
MCSNTAVPLAGHTDPRKYVSAGTKIFQAAVGPLGCFADVLCTGVTFRVVDLAEYDRQEMHLAAGPKRRDMGSEVRVVDQSVGVHSEPDRVLVGESISVRVRRFAKAALIFLYPHSAAPITTIPPPRRFGSMSTIRDAVSTAAYSVWIASSFVRSSST